MKERGMIFNGEMVRAILDGRKTQTRRIMKNQPAGDYPETPALIRNVGTGFQWHGLYGESSIFNCPLGSIGERIWVRETFRVHSRATDVATLVYRASVRNSWTEQTHRVPVAVCNKPATPEKWTPSIHMPRWASRITLEITDVRVERLNSISDSDASKEGCCIADMESGDCLSDVFTRLWTSIYGDDSWQANPWVWVIKFKRVEGATL
ncbi:hypothetical protein [Salmonella enterica]|uniref:hypothetical protein n=1 Tax=Salmonella enterica TaxID=28901 RepID=UPI00315F4BD0